MNCPVCNGISSRVFEKYNYWILECKKCNHRFCDIQPSPNMVNIYNDRYFTGGGAGYSNYVAESNLLIAHGERYGTLLNKYTTAGTVLDIGSAAGFILKGLKNKGWDGRGIEPNSSMVEYARTNLGINIEVGTLETTKINEQFKLVTMIQVIAHFYDIRKALQVATELTEQNGYWLVETWNKDSWIARMLGQNWYEYSPPSVLQWFSPRTLKLLAAQYGFTEVAKSRPEKWIEAGHAKSLLKYKLHGSKLEPLSTPLINLVPDKMAVPYPSYDLFVMLFQKNIVPQAAS